MQNSPSALSGLAAACPTFSFQHPAVIRSFAWCAERQGLAAALPKRNYRQRSKMSSAFNKVVKRKIHKERASVKRGFLERHKDYKERAKDYHRKDDTLRSLKEKAALKNPDEFFMQMNSNQTKVLWMS